MQGGADPHGPAAGPVEAGGELAAGSFASWAVATRDAIDGRHDAEVPCGDCTACCTSSQFVHIEPDEADTLSRIPSEVLFPAPYRPEGHVLMGYDEHGHCPMFRDGRCSIYEHRPRTCRTYDCRVFPATGVFPEADDKPSIVQRARRWRFDLGGDMDRARAAAVRAAAAELQEQAVADPSRRPDATQLAARAVAIHDAHL